MSPLVPHLPPSFLGRECPGPHLACHPPCPLPAAAEKMLCAECCRAGLPLPPMEPRVGAPLPHSSKYHRPLLRDPSLDPASLLSQKLLGPDDPSQTRAPFFLPAQPQPHHECADFSTSLHIRGLLLPPLWPSFSLALWCWVPPSE